MRGIILIREAMNLVGAWGILLRGRGQMARRDYRRDGLTWANGAVTFDRFWMIDDVKSL